MLPIEQSALRAATLISERKLAQASDILLATLTAIRERNLFRSKWDVVAEAHLPQHQLCVNDLVFLPLSKGNVPSYPDWEDDFFNLPFCFLAPAGKASTTIVTDSLAKASAGACLYMLGLCYQLAAREQIGRQCPEEALKVAIDFYSQAWTTLQEASPASVPTDKNATALNDSSITFLLMAIATNAGSCSYELADLRASNIWFDILREMLTFCWLNDDHLSLELHNFFLMTSTINTTFVAASAA